MSLYEEQKCTTLRIGYQVAATVKNVVSICVLQCFLDVGLFAESSKTVRATLLQYQNFVKYRLQEGSISDAFSHPKTHKNSIEICCISELDFRLILRRFWEGF